METSDSDYFESADEDFYLGENDSNKTKIKNNLDNDNRSDDVKALKNLYLQDSEPLNGESGTKLINENLKISSKEHSHDTKNEITQISASRNAQVEVEQQINIGISYEDDTFDNNVKLNSTIEEVNQTKQVNENQLSKNDTDHLTVICNDDLIGNDSNIKLSIDSDDLWNEGEGWGVDDEGDGKKNQEIVCVKDIDGHREEYVKIKDCSKTSTDVGHIWNDWEKTLAETEIDYNKTDYNKGDNNSSIINGITSPHMWAKWGNWGVSSVLSTASQSVATLNSSISQSISTVLETSISDSEKQKSDQNENSLNEESQNRNSLHFGFGNIGNLVTGVSKLVESTSTKVISGGLDTLETIGKMTMDVLQEGDPGLKKKRAFLKLNTEKPVLSQVLREAKEKIEQENEVAKQKHVEKKKNYEILFDDHQGLVHLEALEMLSKECEVKLQILIESSPEETLKEIKETIHQVKELCELPDEDENEEMSSDEIKERIKSAENELGIHTTYDRLICSWEETELWLNNLKLSICDEGELHQQAVDTLAQLTAITIERFHKTGELLFIKKHHSTADEADSLLQLTTTLTSLIGIVARKFSEKLNAKTLERSNKENINSLITNVFFEAAKSSSYIQDAFQLLVPILQMGSVQLV